MKYKQNKVNKKNHHRIFVVTELALSFYVVYFPHMLVNRFPVTEFGVAKLAGQLLLISLVPTSLVLTQALKCVENPVSFQIQLEPS
jgi:hypothetical protein